MNASALYCPKCLTELRQIEGDVIGNKYGYGWCEHCQAWMKGDH